MAARLSAVFIRHAYQWLSTFPREYDRLEPTSLYAPSQPANDGRKADFTPTLPPPRGLVQLVQLLQQMQKLKQSKENKRRKAEIAGTSIQQSILPPSRRWRQAVFADCSAFYAWDVEILEKHFARSFSETGVRASISLSKSGSRTGTE